MEPDEENAPLNDGKVDLTAKGCGCALIIFVLVIAALLSLASCSIAEPANASLIEPVTRGLPGSPVLPGNFEIVTDQGTGCEYIFAAGGYLTPRFERADDSGDINGKSRVKGCRE